MTETPNTLARLDHTVNAMFEKHGAAAVLTEFTARFGMAARWEPLSDQPRYAEAVRHLTEALNIITNLEQQ